MLLFYTLIKFQPIGRNFKVNMVICYGAPEPFDKDVINSPSLAIHTNPYTFFLKKINPFMTGKLYYSLFFNHHTNKNKMEGKKYNNSTTV